MKNELATKHTSLSTSTDVLETINWKLQRVQDEGLPIQESIADYIGLSLDEIEAQLSQLKAVKSEVTAREKALKEQITRIKTGAAEFLEKFGVDRLEGNIVSSVTLSRGKAAAAKKKFTLLVPKAQSEQYLIDAGLAALEEIETAPTPDTIRINKRKVLPVEVEDN